MFVQSYSILGITIEMSLNIWHVIVAWAGLMLLSKKTLTFFSSARPQIHFGIERKHLVNRAEFLNV